MARRSFTLLLCTAAATLGRGALAGPPPGAAEVRGAYYSDNEGLTVVTTSATVEQEVGSGVSVSLQALADRIVVRKLPRTELRGGGQPTGHQDAVDAVTSASIAVSGGERSEKWRIEGIAGAGYATRIWGAPARLQLLVRGSHERDYRSLSGLLRGSVELFEQNLTLAAFAGYGHDLVSPLESPPGERDLWPASHDRVNVGATATQVLSPTLVLSLGGAYNHQFGRLANPYRRALVMTTLFPEELPSTRDRGTAFVGVAWNAGDGIGIHVRQGGYLDSWGVAAVIPEIALAKEVGEEALIALRYRYYRQSAASFYAPRYQDLLSVRSSDARLGRVEEHFPSFELRWKLVGSRSDSRSLTLTAGWGLSFMRYPLIGLETSAVVLDLGLSGSY